MIKDLWSNLKTPTPKEIQCEIENKMQTTWNIYLKSNNIINVKSFKICKLNPINPFHKQKRIMKEKSGLDDVTLLISLNDTKTMIVNVCLNIDGVT